MTDGKFSTFCEVVEQCTFSSHFFRSIPLIEHAILSDVIPTLYGNTPQDKELGWINTPRVSLKFTLMFTLMFRIIIMFFRHSYKKPMVICQAQGCSNMVLEVH